MSDLQHSFAESETQQLECHYVKADSIEGDKTYALQGLDDRLQLPKRPGKVGNPQHVCCVSNKAKSYVSSMIILLTRLVARYHKGCLFPVTSSSWCHHMRTEKQRNLPSRNAYLVVDTRDAHKSRHFRLVNLVLINLPSMRLCPDFHHSSQQKRDLAHCHKIH